MAREKSSVATKVKKGVRLRLSRLEFAQVFQAITQLDWKSKKLRTVADYQYAVTAEVATSLASRLGDLVLTAAHNRNWHWHIIKQERRSVTVTKAEALVLIICLSQQTDIRLIQIRDNIHQVCA